MTESEPWTTTDVAAMFESSTDAEAVLGPTLSYNFGTIEPNADIHDAEAHLRFTTRSLYRWIPTGARVLDIGCGWGGPGLLLATERNATMHGVTVSRTGAGMYRAVVPGATASIVDMKDFDDGRAYDVAIALESITHSTHRPEIFRRTRDRADRFIYRDHLSTGEPWSSEPWKMEFPSHAQLTDDLERAGFTVEFDEKVDVPWETVARYWLLRLARAYPLFVPPGQWTLLRDLCRSIVSSGAPTHQIRLIVAR